MIWGFLREKFIFLILFPQNPYKFTADEDILESIIKQLIYGLSPLH